MRIISTSFKYGRIFYGKGIEENYLYRIDVEFKIGKLKGIVSIETEKFLSEEELIERTKEELRRASELC